MGVRYHNPTDEEIARSLASECPSATPIDPSGCKGSRCIFWHRLENKPCNDIRTARDWKTIPIEEIKRA